MPLERSRVMANQHGFEYFNDSLPTIRPTLNLNFAAVKRLDPRITFTRASTGTYYDVNGVLRTAAAGVPRFDHNPSTLESLGLLIEEQRTNLLLQSEDLSTTWGLGDGTVTANTHIAPDGSMTADTYTIGTISNVPNQNATIAAATTYTISGFFHADSTANHIRIRISTAAASVSAFINISTKTFGSLGAGFSGGVVTALPNNLYRFSVQYLPAAGDEGLRQFAFAGVIGNNSGTADTGKTLVLWGAQLEAGAFPTSYIPTTASAATRNADIATMTGTNFSSWYNQTEGTIVADAGTFATGSQNRVFYVDDNSFNEGIECYFNASINTANIAVETGNVSQGTISQGADVDGAKITYAYKLNDTALSVAGASVTADTSVTLPTVDRIGLGNRPVQPSAAPLNGHISRLTYFPVRLSNTLLQGLSI